MYIDYKNYYETNEKGDRLRDEIDVCKFLMRCRVDAKYLSYLISVV